jgi:hypothetical protein
MDLEEDPFTSALLTKQPLAFGKRWVYCTDSKTGR